MKSRKEKRKDRKTKARDLKKKKKTLAKRHSIREEAKFEKELEQIRGLVKEDSITFRKPKNES